LWELGVPGTQRNEIFVYSAAKYGTNDYLKYYPPREMAAVYGKSKIVFNASINGDVNMRVFEAMAAGALLITDRIGNGLPICSRKHSLYRLHHDSEALEKIGYFLDNSSERDRIPFAASVLCWRITPTTVAGRLSDKNLTVLWPSPARILSRRLLANFTRTYL